MIQGKILNTKIGEMCNTTNIDKFVRQSTGTKIFYKWNIQESQEE